MLHFQQFAETLKARHNSDEKEINLIREPWPYSTTRKRKAMLALRTVKLRVPKKVVRPGISANVSVSNKSIV
jgi:hypothetical protein